MKNCLIVFMLVHLSWPILAAQNNIDMKDEIAIKETALDYAEGYYDGDGDRMERALHTDLNKVYAVTLRQTGKTLLRYSTVSQLVEMSRAKAGYVEPDKRNLTVTVLSKNGDIACAKLTSAFFNDYLQMVNLDGQWKIVNVLWALGPDARNRPLFTGFNPANEKPTIESTAKEYHEGSFTGDVAKLEKAIHPEISIAQLRKAPRTGKYVVSRNGASVLLEVARAKMRVVPEDQRQVNITTLDIMDGMAFVETLTSNSTSYLQLQQIDGLWHIVNVLSVPIPNAR